MRWTDEDISLLHDHYGVDDTKIIAEVLGRCPNTVRAKARKLGLSSSRNKLKTTQTYAQEVATTHYVLEDYINNTTPILHRHIPCGYEWKVRPADILKRSSCPNCNYKIKKDTSSYKEELPADISCLGTYINYRTPVLHKHLVCNYEWLVSPSGILAGTGCPKCANNLKSTTAEYSSKMPDGFSVLGLYTNNRTALLHRHDICQYQWETTPTSFLKSARCPSCTNRILHKTTHSYRVELSLLDKDIICLGVYTNNKTPTLHKHRACGHEWLANPDNVLHKSGCPKCANKVSSVELRVLELINTNYTGKVIHNDRKVLGGRELDILLPDLGLAFEINGIYWHSEKRGKDKTYHISKTTEAAANGVRLVHIFETEIVNSWGIVESRILNLLGKSKRIFARKCEVRIVGTHEAITFQKKNHIQGPVGATTKLGIYAQEELVGLMTFGAARYAKEYDFELLRYCPKLGTTIVGGAGKLFKHFTRSNPHKSIISYCDIRWGTGELYSKLGFTLTHISKPNYWYFNNMQLQSRVKYQKHKLEKILPKFDKDLTEYENMVSNGYNRIWDCGNKVYGYTDK